MKILVAGFGNLLRGDDGFGVLLVGRLVGHPELPPGVVLLDAGIGGISLVQELLSGYGALVVLDAVDGAIPGTLHVREAEVADIATMPEAARQDFFADVHYAEPNRALLLASAVGALPARVVIVGCVPASCELGEGLSSAVGDSLDQAVITTLAVLRRLSAHGS